MPQKIFPIAISALFLLAAVSAGVRAQIFSEWVGGGMFFVWVLAITIVASYWSTVFARLWEMLEPYVLSRRAIAPFCVCIVGLFALISGMSFPFPASGGIIYILLAILCIAVAAFASRVFSWGKWGAGALSRLSRRHIPWMLAGIATLLVVVFALPVTLPVWLWWLVAIAFGWAWYLDFRTGYSDRLRLSPRMYILFSGFVFVALVVRYSLLFNWSFLLSFLVTAGFFGAIALGYHLVAVVRVFSIVSDSSMPEYHPSALSAVRRTAHEFFREYFSSTAKYATFILIAWGVYAWGLWIVQNPNPAAWFFADDDAQSTDIRIERGLLRDALLENLDITAIPGIRAPGAFQVPSSLETELPAAMERLVEIAALSNERSDPDEPISYLDAYEILFRVFGVDIGESISRVDPPMTFVGRDEPRYEIAKAAYYRQLFPSDFNIYRTIDTQHLTALVFLLSGREYPTTQNILAYSYRYGLENSWYDASLSADAAVDLENFSEIIVRTGDLAIEERGIGAE